MTPVSVHQGDSPIVLGLPHAGTFVPDEIASQLNANGRALADTDWHIDTLYDGLLPGATTVRANFHRYVIDANRNPKGVSLYPGQNTTTLVPTTDFDGSDIWETPPTDNEIKRRVTTYHAAYHAALQAELEGVKSRHGHVILYDCHSIRSQIPHLFVGTLPDLNVGTFLGRSCWADVERAVYDACQTAPDYSAVLNGRFQGGWTTRHYGQPDEGFHAIQMEISQSAYLSEEAAPWSYDKDKAERLRGLLQTILSSLADWRPNS